MRDDGVGVEVAAPGAVRGVGVGLRQPRGVRTQRPVDEQVTGQPGRAGRRTQLNGLRGGAHWLAPVADDLHAVVDVAQLLPVTQAPDLGARALVDRDDAVGGGGVEGREAGAAALVGGEQLPCGRAHPVVGVVDQGLLIGVPGRVGEPGDPSAQPGGGQRAVHVDAGQIHRPLADDRVELGGAGGDRIRPAGLIPAVPPDQLVGVRGGGACRCGDQLQAVRPGGRAAQIQPDQAQPGLGEVHVGVDERGGDETAGQVDEVGVGELVPADRIAAQPGDHPVAHRHRGRVGVAGAVDTAPAQQGGHQRQTTGCADPAASVVGSAGCRCARR